VSVVSIRRCEGCFAELPLLARSNRRYHDDRCRAIAQRRRQRERLDRELGDAAVEAELRDAVERATSETRLIANIAKAASSGTWRASAYLLEHLHGWGVEGAGVETPLPRLAEPDDPFAEVDQIAERRRQKLGV
jgi:hypothetical protein